MPEIVLKECGGLINIPWTPIGVGYQASIWSTMSLTVSGHRPLGELGETQTHPDKCIGAPMLFCTSFRRPELYIYFPLVINPR